MTTMTELEQARAELREAERALAQAQGQRQAASTQVAQARQRLAELGVAEDEVEGRLQALDREAAMLRAQLDGAETVAGDLLDRKGVPVTSGTVTSGTVMPSDGGAEDILSVIDALQL